MIENIMVMMIQSIFESNEPVPNIDSDNFAFATNKRQEHSFREKF